jgi:hypothetical protein
MSDRNQEPSETAGPASGEDFATAEPTRDGGRVGGAPADESQQQAEGVLPRGQRATEAQPGQERAAGTEQGAGDTTGRVSVDDSAGRPTDQERDQERDQRGGTGTEAAGTTVLAEDSGAVAGGQGRAALFAGEERDRLGGQWDAVQAAFVDDPRAAVERADALVAEVVQSLTTSFTDERSRLERQWSQGEDVSTEDLRQALQRYRSFFERLLHV